MTLLKRSCVSVIVKEQIAKGEGQEAKSNNLYVLCSMLYILCFLFLSSAAAQPTEQRVENPLYLAAASDARSYVALCKAVYWEHMRDYQEVERQLKTAIELDPNSSFLHAKLAEILISSLRNRRSEDRVRAVEIECEKALQLNPRNADAHYLLGILKSIQGRRQDAISELKMAAELKPEHLDAQHRLATLLFKAQDYGGAARAYSEVVKLKPYDHELRNMLGRSYSMSGETEKAIKEFNAAIRIRRNYLEPHYHLAFLYGRQSRNREAIEECLTFLRSVPGEPNITLLLAEFYVAVDEFDKAILRLERFLKRPRMRRSTSAEAHFRLAMAYEGKEETSLAESHFQESIDTYKKILGENQRNSDVHYSIAVVYDAKGDSWLAERHLRKYIELNPDEPDAYNFLGYTFVQHETNLEEAISLIKKAVAIEPRNGAFRDSLGWAYFKLGNLDEAIEELEKAVEFMPDDSEVREHLGEAYLKRGGSFTEKAVLEWEKALEIKPKNTELQKRLEELRGSLGLTDNNESEMQSHEEEETR